MSKTKWGIVLVVGLVMALLGVAIASSVGGGPPSEDFANDCTKYGAGFVSLIGIAMFFAGAVKFSRG